MPPANQIVQDEVSPDIDEAEQFGLMAQLVLAKKATFDKPAKNQHMRPLYLRGYVNGKPLTKMFVDGRAAVNVMPYTTFRKLCRMDLPGPTTSVGTRTNYSVGPWDYPSCATRHLKAWSIRTTQE
jgi:hypothetical protein